MDEVNLIGSVVALRENEVRPAFILGTSSDKIGTTDGQAYFATLSKDLAPLLGIEHTVAPYLGASYGTCRDTTTIIGGITLGFGRIPAKWSSTIIFDGVRFRGTIDRELGRGNTLGLILVGGDEPGVSWSLQF